MDIAGELDDDGKKNLEIKTNLKEQMQMQDTYNPLDLKKDTSSSPNGNYVFPF